MLIVTIINCNYGECNHYSKCNLLYTIASVIYGKCYLWQTYHGTCYYGKYIYGKSIMEKLN